MSDLIALADQTEQLARQARAAGRPAEADRLEGVAGRYRAEWADKCEAERRQRDPFTDWDKRHGGCSVIVRGTILWPDGARAAGGDPENWRFEPPENPYERLLLQRDYHQEALRRWEANFASTKAEFVEQAGLAIRFRGQVPGAPEDARQQLEVMAERITHHRAELNKVIAALEQTEQVKQERREQEAKNYVRSLDNQAMAAIQSVSI
ncbi:MAG: hypothetical protein ABSG86_04205 [Thermoguttaceae bacterium]|jgi:hypothetical protein